jgi:hypothetical protein
MGALKGKGSAPLDTVYKNAVGKHVKTGGKGK